MISEASVNIVKMVSTVAVSSGVGSIVSSAAKLVVPKANAKVARRFFTKASVFVGSAVLSSMVADQAVKYTEAKIDSAADGINTALAVVDAIKTEYSGDSETIKGETVEDDKA